MTISTADACAQARVSPEHLDAAVESGQLTYDGVDAAGQPVFSYAEIRAWVERGRPRSDLDSVC